MWVTWSLGYHFLLCGLQCLCDWALRCSCLGLWSGTQFLLCYSRIHMAVIVNLCLLLWESPLLSIVYGYGWTDIQCCRCYSIITFPDYQLQPAPWRGGRMLLYLVCSVTCHEEGERKYVWIPKILIIHHITGSLMNQGCRTRTRESFFFFFLTVPSVGKSGVYKNKNYIHLLQSYSYKFHQPEVKISDFFSCVFYRCQPTYSASLTAQPVRFICSLCY